MKRRDWNLLVLAAAEGDAMQPVQLQKALFLLGQRLRLQARDDYYQFVPYHYGPFDANVYRDADELVNEGFAFVTTRRWNSYGATPSGLKRAEALARDHEPTWKFVQQLVAWIRQRSFEGLLRSVYAEFPEYRASSVFRG